MAELRTKKEISRDARNKKICSDYETLRSENPDTTRNRILKSLEDKYNIEAQMIRKILINNNAY